MNPDAPPIYVITGQLSAGKSTVARALMDHYARGVHIDVDGIRELVTSGRASPLEWTDETTRQFDLAVRGAAALARIYAEAGFAVAIEGGMDPEVVERALDAEGVRNRMIGVILQPRLDVALERNRSRTTKSFDTGIIESVMREIDGDLARDADRDGWQPIDNSDEDPSTTTQRILSIRR